MATHRPKYYSNSNLVLFCLVLFGFRHISTYQVVHCRYRQLANSDVPKVWPGLNGLLCIWDGRYPSTALSYLGDNGLAHPFVHQRILTPRHVIGQYQEVPRPTVVQTWHTEATKLVCGMLRYVNGSERPSGHVPPGPPCNHHVGCMKACHPYCCMEVHMGFHGSSKYMGSRCGCSGFEVPQRNTNTVEVHPTRIK